MEKKKPRASRDIFIYTLGTTLRQLVGFIMLPIYTTYLKPADYGIVALLTLSIAIFELVLGARFAQAIPRFYYDAKDESEQKLILSTALTITGAVSLFGFLLVWQSREMVSDALFGTIDNSIYISIFAFLLFSTGVERYGMTYLRMLERPIAFVVSSLLKFVIQISLNIYLVVMHGYGVMGVVISSVVSSLVFCIIFILLIYGRCGFSFDVSLIKKLFKYTWPLWVAGGVSLIIHSSNRFFIRSYWGLEDVGLFELAVRFSAILGILVWQPFSHWWQTERFRILKHLEENPAQYQLVFDTVTTVMVFFGAAIAILSGPVIVLMSAKEFHGAITAVAPLTYSVLFLKFGMFMNFCFLASDKTIVISYLKYIAAVTNVALLLLFIPDYGFVGAAYAVLIANFLLFLITYFWGKRSLDLGVGLGFLFKSLFLLAGVTLIDSLLLAQAPFIMGLVYKFALLTLYLVISVYLLHQNKPTSHLVSAAFEKVKLRFL